MSAAAMNYMTRWRKSSYKCPACDRMLWTMTVGDGRVWWCGWGTCPSDIANNGASTIEELRKNVEEEPEYYESED